MTAPVQLVQLQQELFNKRAFDIVNVIKSREPYGMAGEFFDGPLCRQQRRGTPHFPVYKTTSPVVQPYGLTLSVVPVSRVCGYGEHQGCFFVLAHTTSKVYHCGRSDSSFHPASLCNSCYYGSPRTPQLSSLRGGYVLIGQTS